MMNFILKKILGTKNERELKRLQPMVVAINAREDAIRKLSDAELQAKTAEFKQKLANGAKLDDLLIDAFAVTREAGRRALGMRHFDVQLIGGMVLHEGKIAEMRTGEGKTLVATLPCYLNALSGKGVHVVTVNDYLAKRDAEWMGKLHNFLGLSVGTVVNQQGNAEKMRAYRADITYGQNNEFGFDYLRDNMKFSIYDYAQRELNYAIVDEVDSILIDEARTPLIISGPGETASEKYMRINEIIPRLRKDEHYQVDEKAHSVTLTEYGIEHAQKLLFQKGVTQVENLFEPVNLETLHILQQSLRAHTLYKRDQHYMVSEEGEVLIIDEFTGRVLAGRRWSDGLHQAVEAKEQVPIQDENMTLATISFQNLFRLYNKLSGMTGTAETEASEFHKIYKLDVVPIPTNKPISRTDFEDVIYKTERAKFKAVIDEIKNCNERGQPVLVGTTSVEKSDALARMLERENIDHNVLNAKQHEREAYVVAQAGRKGSVTVATNMAGRGTDIILGGNPEMLARLEVMARAQTDETLRDAQAFEDALHARTKELEPLCAAEKQDVLKAGGVHILGTERHESRRIDNQLRGRAGRQGDPGSSRFFLSLEDDLMRIFGGERLSTMMDRMGMEEDVPIEHRWVTSSVETAQKKVEERNFDIRKHLLEYDDVMNQQRKTIYALRKQILEGRYFDNADAPKDEAIQASFTRNVKDIGEHAVPLLNELLKHHTTTASSSTLNAEHLRALEQNVYLVFGYPVDLSDTAGDQGKLLERLTNEVPRSLAEQKERVLDLLDEICSAMVDRACPPNKDADEWDYEALGMGYEEAFGIKATGLDKLATRDDLAHKLYSDAESVLLRKEKEFGVENYLRLSRTFYLQEIDRLWIEHLQTMESLRDGIGLRGYGQRDPKKEYKKEGYHLFVQMMENIKASVMNNMMRVERLAEEDVERLEADRRRRIEAQQRRMHMNHEEAADVAPDGSSGASRQRMNAEPARPIETVRRERPKIGRNDPCWCGSGKKYKACHLREDEAQFGSA